MRRTEGAGQPHKVAFRLRPYDVFMRARTVRMLPIAIFLGLAIAFDYFSVAAIAEVGFDGVQRVLLSAICLIVGTISAFTLTRPLVRRLASLR
jgi:hypothetical protein